MLDWLGDIMKHIKMVADKLLCASFAIKILLGLYPLVGWLPYLVHKIREIDFILLCKLLLRFNEWKIIKNNYLLLFQILNVTLLSKLHVLFPIALGLEADCPIH